MKSIVHTLVATSVLALLAACGGDGGDSPNHPTSAPVAITATNQTDVARASINGGLAVALAQGSLGGGASPASVTDRSHATGAALGRVMHAVLGQRKGVASAGAHAAAVSTDTSACADGGSFTTTFDDKDGNGQVSGGDVITAVFAQCRDTATLTISGTVAITVSGTPTATQFSANAQFQQVSVADLGATSTIDGQVGITEVDTSTRSDSTLTVGSAGLTVGVASSSYTDTLVFDAGTAFAAGLDITSGDATVTTNGGFSSQRLAGHVAIATVTPLFEAAADAYPSSGVVRITGASGSKLLLTVLSNTQVQLQLDANGDGTYEGTDVVAWATLVP